MVPCDCSPAIHISLLFLFFFLHNKQSNLFFLINKTKSLQRFSTTLPTHPFSPSLQGPLWPMFCLFLDLSLTTVLLIHASSLFLLPVNRTSLPRIILHGSLFTWLSFCICHTHLPPLGEAVPGKHAQKSLFPFHIFSTAFSSKWSSLPVASGFMLYQLESKHHKKGCVILFCLAHRYIISP